MLYTEYELHTQQFIYLQRWWFAYYKFNVTHTLIKYTSLIQYKSNIQVME